MEFARRLEDTEVAVSESCLQSWVARYPELGSTAAPLAGGKALFFGTSSPLSQALGVGMRGPVSPDDFDRLESFFRARGAPVVISLCPHADPSVIAHLHARRYRITHFENTLVRPVEGQFPLPPTRLGVRRADPTERDLWSRTVMLGFSDGQPVSDDMVSLFAIFFHAESASAWFAFDQSGRPAGGGMISVIGRYGMLYGDSTLPESRGAGMQSALIAARLRQASLAGCTLAVACTLPGSTSQRNYERAGFRVAYTKTMFAQDLT